MAFGIRNVPDRSKALREIRRIMATPALDVGAQGATEDAGGAGGQEPSSSVVAILELQDPESGLLASASRAFIK